MEPTNYYDKWFFKKIHQQPTISKKIIFNEVIRLLDEVLAELNIQDCRHLDIGCGAGHLIRRILQHLPDLDVTGVDITDKVIDSLKKHYPEAHFKKLNYSESLTSIEQYNVVTAVEIIEHIPYKRQPVFIKNIWKSLKPGGRFILTTPNMARAHRIPAAFRNTQPVEDWLTIEQLTAMVEPGFEKVKIGTCIWYFPQRPIDALFKRLLYPFHVGIEQDLIRKTELGGHIVLSAVKKNSSVYGE